MRIKMCFQGWVTAEIDHLVDATGNKVSLDGMDSSTVQSKLESGELLASLSDSLENSVGGEEIQLHDFEAE